MNDATHYMTSFRYGPWVKEAVGEKIVRQLRGKRILLTGALGFLGRNFLDFFVHLLEEDAKYCQLFALDVSGLLSYHLPLPSKTAERITLLEQDLLDESKALPTVDYIIHAASIASPVHYRERPLDTLKVNAWGCQRLLDHIMDTNPSCRMVYISSSEVYGDPVSNAIPTPESYWGRVSFTGPRACYDESKRFAETLCTLYAQEHGTQVCSVRPFNVYGPGLSPDDGRVISDFMRDCITQSRIELFSDGSPTRTFCFVADGIQGIVKALAEGGPGEAYNIGQEKPEISMLQLAHTIANLAKEKHGTDIAVSHKFHEDTAYLTDNPQRRCPDLTKAAKELNYHPQWDLAKGLNETYNYYYALLK